MWGYLANSHAQITASENIANSPYIFLVLFANLAYRWIPVDAKPMILIILDLVLYFEDPLSPSWYGIPPGTLNQFLSKHIFSLSFDVLRTLLLTGCSCGSKDHTHLLAGTSCICSSVGDDANVFFIIYVCNDAWFMSWIFYGIPLKQWSEPGIFEVNFLVRRFVRCVAQDLSNFGLLRLH